MIVLAPTIMHSGSNTLWYGVLRKFHPFEITPQTDLENELPKQNCVLMGHITDQMVPVWEKMIQQGYPIITMMRHPARALASHLARGEKDERWMLWYAQQWMNHIELWKRHTPYLIHVDQPELRDRQLEIINDELGLALNYGWRISKAVGCYHGTHERLDEMHVNMIPKAFLDYYEETVNAYK